MENAINGFKLLLEGFDYQDHKWSKTKSGKNPKGVKSEQIQNWSQTKSGQKQKLVKIQKLSKTKSGKSPKVVKIK